MAAAARGGRRLAVVLLLFGGPLAKPLFLQSRLVDTAGPGATGGEIVKTDADGTGVAPQKSLVQCRQLMINVHVELHRRIRTR